MEIKVKFRHAEVVAEVLNKSDLTSRSYETGDTIVAAENMKANTEEYSVTQILRSIQNAISSIMVHFSPYEPLWGIKTTSGEVTIYESFLSGDNYLRLYEKKNDSGQTINIDNVALYVRDLPSNFDETMVDTIAALVHSYAVNTALYDWFMLTFANAAPAYKTAAESDLANLKMTLNRRRRPKRSEVN